MTLPELENIFLFVATATLMIMIPGPAVIYILTKSVMQGNRAGVASTLGTATGGIAHVIATSLGLSAILMFSATAFAILKYCGAICLIYLGIKKLLTKNDFSPEIISQNGDDFKKIFWEGIMVNILNPKTALFFLIFLPQFINEEKGGIPSQVFFLGLLFILLCIIIDLIFVYISAHLGKFIRSSHVFQKFNNYVIGSIYLILGGLTLLTSSPAKTFTANHK